MIKDNLNKIIDSIEKIKDKNNLKNEIKLMAVSKTKPVVEIVDAYNAGQKLFGENRILEAYEKFNDPSLKKDDISLHIIGHLQRNKAKKAIEIADMVQSIDKIETLEVIDKISNDNNKIIDYLIEINTTNEEQKYGISPDALESFLEQINKKDLKNCKLKGLMTIGPYTYDNGLIRNVFSTLYKLFDKTKNELSDPDFKIISMGMSNDYEIAIEEGSNLIRIGSLLFENR